VNVEGFAVFQRIVVLPKATVLPTTAKLPKIALSHRLGGIALFALACACQRTKSEPDATASTASSVSAKPTASAAASAKPQKPELVPLPGGTVAALKGVKPHVYQVPLPPTLGIFPGKGVGAIRFGATVETIERLMSNKCEERTETLCGYTARAIDFHLDGGVVDEIRIHGDERRHSDNPEDTYGIFNGRFEGGAALGMYAQFVQESLGKPSKVEKVESNGRFPTVERHYYDKFVLEYDTLENKNVVLAGVVMTKSGTSASAAKAGKSAPTTTK